MKQPKTATISHQKRLYVTVGEATVETGIRRQQLAREARGDAPDDFERQLLRLLVYPDLIAAVVDQHGFEQWPISFDEYLNLPEQFAADWEQAVYRLNPHWVTRNEKKPPDDLYRRLTELINERHADAKAPAELPDEIDLADEPRSWRVWQLMEATGWRFLPSQLMAEPEWLMNDLLTLAVLHGKIERMTKKD